MNTSPSSTNVFSIDKVTAALETLEEASLTKADEIKNLIDKKFGKLKKTIGRVSNESQDFVENYGEKFQETATKIDAHVRDHTWSYVGGAAVCGLLLGFIMGRRN